MLELEDFLNRNYLTFGDIKIVKETGKYKLVIRDKSTNLYGLKDIVFSMCKCRKEYLLPQEALSEEFILQYGIELLEYVGYVPNVCNSNEYLFNYCIEKKKYNFLLQFKDIKLQSQIMDNIDYNRLNNIMDDILNNSIILDYYENSVLLFDRCISTKKYDLLFWFSGDEIRNYASKINVSDDLFKFIVDNSTFDIWEDNYYLFEKLIQAEKWEIIAKKMNPKFITEDILKEYNEQLSEVLDWNDIKRFSDNAALLKEILLSLDEEDFEDVHLDYFKFSTIEKCIDECGDIIVKICLLHFDRSDYEFSFFDIEKQFFKSEKIFLYCLDNHKELLEKFETDVYTDDLLNNNIDKIISSFEIEIPYNLKDNRRFLELCLEKEEFVLAITSSALYVEDIRKYFEVFKHIFYQYKEKKWKCNLQENSNFLLVCLEQNNYDFINDFSFNVINDEKIVPYYSQIYKYYGGNILNENFFKSKKFFNICLENKDYSQLEKFRFWRHEEEVEEIIKENLNQVLEACNYYVPSIFLQSTILLKIFVKEKRDDFLLKFSYKAIDGLGDTEEDNACLSYIANLVKDNFSEEFTYSFKLFEYYINRNDFVNIEKFDLNFIFSSRKRLFLDDEHYNKRQIFLQSNMCKIMLCIDDNENKLPTVLANNIYCFEYCIKEKKYALLYQFNFKNIYMEEHLRGYFNKNSMSKFMSDLFKSIEEYNDSVIPESVKYFSELRDYIIEHNKFNLLEQLPFKQEDFDEKNFKEDSLLKFNFYENVLGYSKEAIREKLNKYLEKNDEIFKTALAFMFSKRMDCIEDKVKEKLLLYPDLQLKLYKLDNKQLEIIAKVMSVIDNSDIDLSGVLVKILNNLDNYKELLLQIDINNLSEVEVNNLILVISKKKNIYSITSLSDLSDNVFNNKIRNYYNTINKKIDENQIDIEELKEAIFVKCFGIGIEDAKFIVERYCHDMEALKNSGLDDRIYNVLKSINSIFKNDDLNHLKPVFYNTKRTISDYNAAFSLEATIRSSYAKMYNESLYKLNNEHKLTDEHELYSTNKEVYNLIKDSNINQGVYIMDGDFNLQIHALGAYREYEVPENFETAWLRPKIAYHGICTSYIANNQIATARVKHPIYGFSEYEESALLCAGNYDLFSDSVISNYDTSYIKPYNMYTPNEMIDNTRHTHNEFVIERRVNNKDGVFKRLPNYIVYIVDDINNKDNFKEDNNLYQETIQAANDHNIPVVIVDRLKYAKIEKEKCNNLVNEFYFTKDYNKLNLMVTNYCNNMVGCIDFDDKPAEYKNIFNRSDLFSTVNKIVNNIPNNFSIGEKLCTIEVLINSFEREKNKGNDLQMSSMLKNMKEEMITHYINGEETYAEGCNRRKR